MSRGNASKFKMFQDVGYSSVAVRKTSETGLCARTHYASEIKPNWMAPLQILHFFLFALGHF
jgi:hypothetical protein